MRERQCWFSAVAASSAGAITAVAAGLSLKKSLRQLKTVSILFDVDSGSVSLIFEVAVASSILTDFAIGLTRFSGTANEIVINELLLRSTSGTGRSKIRYTRGNNEVGRGTSCESRIYERFDRRV